MHAKWSLLLLRASAIFGVIGAFLGSHMAGAGSYAFSAIHAHILVVGWLSLFSWGIFYRLYRVKTPRLAAFHVWSAIIGTAGLTFGMYLYYFQPFGLPATFNTVFFIVGGTTLLVSFIVFLPLTFLLEKIPE